MAKSSFSMTPITVGGGVHTPGSTLHDALVPVVNGVLSLSIALAALAIGIAAVQYMAGPSDEQAFQTVTRVRRILTVCAFLGLVVTVALGITGAGQGSTVQRWLSGLN